MNDVHFLARVSSVWRAPCLRILGVFFTISIPLVILPAESPKAPNIILCMADDQGWGDTGYNGHPILKTPHLDQMAEDGLRFTRFYAAAPVCSPTRGSVLTGRHPMRYGIPWANTGKMPDEEHTLAELLQAQGYRTGHFGKWHLGTLSLTRKDGNRGGRGKAHYAPPWEHGFDTSFSTESKVPTYWKEPGYSSNVGTKYWSAHEQVVEEIFVGDDSAFLMNPALEFIREAVKEEKPFLAVIWFHSPHKPVVYDPGHAAQYEKQKGAAYYGSISAIDHEMGRLRALLQELDIADQTFLAYTSDNGPERGEAGITKGLRDRKRSLFEGGIRVPGLIVWPEKIPPGQVTDIPAVTSDYLPTVLDILGQWMGGEGVDRPIDGISLLPLFDGTMKERPMPIGFLTDRNTRALIDNRYKLVQAGQRKPGKIADEDERLELYDLKQDPAEKQNLAKTHPDILSRMTEQLNTWMKSVEASSKGMDYEQN